MTAYVSTAAGGSLAVGPGTRRGVERAVVFVGPA